MKLKVAFVSSEVEPFSKTGGLADVAGALPVELRKLGVEIIVFTPFYKSIKEGDFAYAQIDLGENLKISVGGKEVEYRVFASLLPGNKVTIYFIDAPEYFHRKEFYTQDDDEAERFVFFQKAVIETLQRMQWKGDIIHVNDWQTSLIPYYLKTIYAWDKLFENTKTVFTIHNIGYQGAFPAEKLSVAEILPEHFYPTGPAEFYGKINFMKLGILFSDKINTVSETYAKEILTPAFSGGLDGVLKQREKDLSGILNGVDYSQWSPQKDPLIPVNYSSQKIARKIENKKALASETGLKFSENTPLMAIISRLVSQKGFDLFLDLFDFFIEADAQLVVLGSGDEKYESFFRKLAFYSEGNIKVHIGYNNKLAHLIEAGADIFLMPSLYEPCGLNQIYSLKYGTVPVVRKTGGLADTVKDWDETPDEKGNGFVFEKFDSSEFANAIERALNYYKDKRIWKKIQRNGMREDFSWRKSAKKYLELYNKTLGK